MADVAVEFRASPAEIRNWFWGDFKDVLKVYRRRARDAKTNRR